MYLLKNVQRAGIFSGLLFTSSRIDVWLIIFSFMVTSICYILFNKYLYAVVYVSLLIDRVEYNFPLLAIGRFSIWKLNDPEVVSTLPSLICEGSHGVSLAI